MIIWRGKGPLVLLSGIIGGLIYYAIINLTKFDSVTTVGVILKGILGTGLIAGSNYFLTKKFVSDEERVFIDEQTGQRIKVKDGSSLFFIPNKYWTWIIIAIGILSTINGLAMYSR